MKMLHKVWKKLIWVWNKCQGYEKSAWWYETNDKCSETNTHLKDAHIVLLTNFFRTVFVWCVGFCLGSRMNFYIGQCAERSSFEFRLPNNRYENRSWSSWIFYFFRGFFIFFGNFVDFFIFFEIFLFFWEFVDFFIFFGNFGGAL